MNAKVVLLLALAMLLPGIARAESAVTFDSKDGHLQIQIGGKPFASYVWEDRNVLRPYFAHLHAPNGKRVTRNHPPVEGKDATDHAAMHPGLWLAFGDLGGADFWRNKATVKHVEFVEKPKTTKDGGSFAVKNRYVSGDRTICEEVCRISISVRPDGYLIDWTSEFTGPEDFSFGDQEEMGLGVRVATPLTVKNGGQILNSDGSKNEKQVWGKQADWCGYGGEIDGQPVGVTLMPDPKNFRRSWFHARAYGVLVANSFGQNAFTKGEKSKVVVKKGETFRLRFGVLVHSGKVDVAAAYKEWLAALPWVEVSKDKKGFVLQPSEKSFVPWGFNYDHDENRRVTRNSSHPQAPHRKNGSDAESCSGMLSSFVMSRLLSSCGAKVGSACRTGAASGAAPPLVPIVTGLGRSANPSRSSSRASAARGCPGGCRPPRHGGFWRGGYAS